MTRFRYSLWALSGQCCLIVSLTAVSVFAQSKDDWFGSDDGDTLLDANGEVIRPTWVVNNSIPESQWSHGHRFAMRLIGKSSVPMHNCNPAALIRVVNHLQSMGKCDAIRAIRDYAAKHYYHPADSRLVAIVQLLFPLTDSQKNLPPRSWFDQKQRVWSFSVELEQDIPFDPYEGFTLGGSIPPTARLVEWAARYGRLRTHPLRPTKNPRDAADRVYRKLTRKGGLFSALRDHRFKEELRTLLYKQASTVVASPAIERR